MVSVVLTWEATFKKCKPPFRGVGGRKQALSAEAIAKAGLSAVAIAKAGPSAVAIAKAGLGGKTPGFSPDHFQKYKRKSRKAG